MMFFILKKSNIIKTIIAVLIFVSGTIAVNAINSGKKDDILIVIDAGHGEPDGGCVGALGTIEQSINLSVARKTAEILEAKNINTKLTRTTSLGLWTEKSKTIREKKIEDMHNRLSIMKNSHGSLFISIHMNSYPNTTAHGMRVFYDRNHPEIKDLADKITMRMKDVTNSPASSTKPVDRNLFLLKDTPMPAILIECGFLSNPSEEQKLKNSEYQSKLAWAISDAIEKHYISLKINQK